MEIDFNPSRVPKPDPGQSVARPGKTPASSDQAAFPAASGLQGKLLDLPLARPERVAQAKALVSDHNYPPGYIVDRIAALLAEHLRK